MGMRTEGPNAARIAAAMKERAKLHEAAQEMARHARKAQRQAARFALDLRRLAKEMHEQQVVDEADPSQAEVLYTTEQIMAQHRQDQPDCETCRIIHQSGLDCPCRKAGTSENLIYGNGSCPDCTRGR